MTKSTQYLIALGCLLLALVMGIIGLVFQGGSWIYVAIPLGLVGMLFAFWTKSRSST